MLPCRSDYILDNLSFNKLENFLFETVISSLFNSARSLRHSRLVSEPFPYNKYLGTWLLIFHVLNKFL